MSMSIQENAIETEGGLKRGTGCALFLALSLVFLACNHAGYRSYFQDDELDNLSWAPVTPTMDFVRQLVSPRFHPHNFRPAAELYFHVMGKWFGLDFSKY